MVFLRYLTIDNSARCLESGNFGKIVQNIESKKKYLLFVEIQQFCSNIEILDYHELSIIFATKTDNSITQKMAKLSIIFDNNNFRYINSNLTQIITALSSASSSSMMSSSSISSLSSAISSSSCFSAVRPPCSSESPRISRKNCIYIDINQYFLTNIFYKMGNFGNL
jgi:hypothetical protein